MKEKELQLFLWSLDKLERGTLIFIVITVCSEFAANQETSSWRKWNL